MNIQRENAGIYKCYGMDEDGFYFEALATLRIKGMLCYDN